MYLFDIFYEVLYRRPLYKTGSHDARVRLIICNAARKLLVIRRFYHSGLSFTPAIIAPSRYELRADAGVMRRADEVLFDAVFCENAVVINDA